MAILEEGEAIKLPQPGAYVGGKFYSFLIDKDYEDLIAKIGPALGATDVNSTRIALNNKVSLHQLKDTVLHELIHAIDYGIGLGLKERQVHTLASALCDLLWSNPDLADWLIHREAVVREAPKKKSKKKAPVKEPDSKL